MVENEWVLNGYSYWIESKIGEGQFGTVHKGRNESGTVVAIKENKDANRCFTEAGILEKFRRREYARYFVQYLKFHDTPIGFYVVMEYCSYGNLEQYIEMNGSFDSETATRHFIHLIKGVDIMHSLGVMHRHLKPANILVSRNNAKGINLKIADFGISKEVVTNRALYQTSFGNQSYMAPEVLQGRSYDMSSDIYSLGAIMFYMTRGRHPGGLHFDQCGYPKFRDRRRGHGHVSIMGRMMCQRREERLKLDEIEIRNDNELYIRGSRDCDMCDREMD